MAIHVPLHACVRVVLQWSEDSGCSFCENFNLSNTEFTIWESNKYANKLILVLYDAEKNCARLMDLCTIVLLYLNINVIFLADLQCLFGKEKIELSWESSNSSHSNIFLLLWYLMYLIWLSAARLPFSIRVLLESAVRNCDGFQVKSKDVENILDWENNQKQNVEIPFMPARVILQDFT